jgi:hypothetical protein
MPRPPLAGGRECQHYGESLLVKSAHAQREPTWRCSMIRLTLLSLVTIPSMALATPVLAQTVIQEPGAYAFCRFNGDLGIGSTPSQRRVEAVVGRGTSDDSLALAPSFRLSAVGKETTTRPRSAPVGHRQPRPADVPASTSASQYVLDQEDANVDRKISGVCRLGSVSATVRRICVLGNIKTLA